MLFFPVFAKLQHRPARQTLPASLSPALTWLTQHSNLQPANRSSVAVAERRSRSGRDTSTWLDSKSFPLNSFADPHPLNSVVSYRYKNTGGRAPILWLQRSNLQPYNVSTRLGP